MTKNKEDQIDQEFVDPMAQGHKRVIIQQINDTEYKFHWNRASVSELLDVLAGNKAHPEDTQSKGFNRMLKKTVDTSQLGLLIEILNNKANFSIARNLISGMLPLLTGNETVIGRPVCKEQGDVKEVEISLSTDGTTERFIFKSDRNSYDEFMDTKHLEDDQVTAVHGFLTDCLEDEEQKLKFSKLDLDERNFTLAVKVFGKVSRFLARNQAITTVPTLERSAK